ncbi:DUF4366 domain-containing protein [Ruminococcaceae bacterium OttesenSCG-928-A16]|nr:DUF4366 domain-containing protein [Ruminococcaceae bacterium OttesenSCG-928-A16]
MKIKAKKRILTLIAAVMLCMAAFPLTAYAGGGESEPEEPPAETVEAVPEPTPEPNPFTPAGTGTVIDNATDADGKEFYTIMTPSENVFYLIIDRQRETENVYFLNAVTEQDLMALAEVSPDTGESAIPDSSTAEPPAAADPDPEPEPEAEPEPEKGGGMGMMIVVVLIVLAGGGAAYYFKIYRPKQEQAAITEDDDYDYEADPYGEDTDPEDDGPPWYDEDEAREEYETTGEVEDE